MSEHVFLSFHLVFFQRTKTIASLWRSHCTRRVWLKRHSESNTGFYQKLKTWAEFLLVYRCKHPVSRREVLGKGPKPPQVTSIFPECLLGTACLSHGQPCARILHVRQQKLSKSNIKKHHQKNMTTDSQPTLTAKKTGWCKSRNMVFSSWTRGHLFWATFLGNICGSPGWCYYNYITLWSFNVVMENHHV